ncbi:hypothetical protein EV128_101504 [Rhizobium azibense]|nr:hypothetical protein EV128_101504 [Rhizobium azibense]
MFAFLEVTSFATGAGSVRRHAILRQSRCAENRVRSEAVAGQILRATRAAPNHDEIEIVIGQLKLPSNQINETKEMI